MLPSPTISQESLLNFARIRSGKPNFLRIFNAYPICFWWQDAEISAYKLGSMPKSCSSPLGIACHAFSCPQLPQLAKMCSVGPSPPVPNGDLNGGGTISPMMSMDSSAADDQQRQTATSPCATSAAAEQLRLNVGGRSAQLAVDKASQIGIIGDYTDPG